MMPTKDWNYYTQLGEQKGIYVKYDADEGYHAIVDLKYGDTIHFGSDDKAKEALFKFVETESSYLSYVPVIRPPKKKGQIRDRGRWKKKLKDK